MARRRREASESLFSRRALILGGGQLALAGLLVGRLQYLQLAQSDKYATLAEDNRVNYEPLSVSRGRIFDRFGEELATNDQNFHLSVIPEQIDDLKLVLAYFRETLALSKAAVSRLEKKILRAPSFQPVSVAENVGWETFSRVNLQVPFLSGVQARVGEKRAYGRGESAAHVIGYVGARTIADVSSPSYFFTGRAGLEKVYDEQLQGSAGNRRVEVNALGRPIRELERRPGEPGQDIVLTLDAEIQEAAFRALGEHSGAVVVMDVQSGAIYALTSAPSYDPNSLSVGISEKMWQALLRDEKKPMLNKALSGLYAPGSAFKMIVVLAALEEGALAEDHKFECTGAYAFGGRDFHCWEKNGHGWLNAEQAIAQSCDVLFYDLALRTGIDAISAMAKKFGFGSLSGIEIPGERSGVMPDRDWKRANYAAGWQPGETVITGIGQGYILSTPIQLARMTAMLANGTHLPRPHVVQEDVQTDTQSAQETFVLKDASIALVRRGMENAVNGPLGTARGSAFNVNGKKMAGKTGTVQVRRITKEEREEGVLKNEDLPRHLRDHALFVGYAPMDKPKFAIATVVEHGGSGSSIAAPISAKVMKRALERLAYIEERPTGTEQDMGQGK